MDIVYCYCFWSICLVYRSVTFSFYWGVSTVLRRIHKFLTIIVKSQSPLEGCTWHSCTKVGEIRWQLIVLNNQSANFTSEVYKHAIDTFRTVPSDNSSQQFGHSSSLRLSSTSNQREPVSLCVISPTIKNCDAVIIN